MDLFAHLAWLAKIWHTGGQHSTMVSLLACGPSCPGFDFQHSPKKISETKIVDVAKVNQWRCLEESAQWLENIDQTNLLRGSGNLVLQKDLGYMRFGSH